MQKIILFLMIGLFSSCDCELQGDGLVYDETTRQPISGASVTVPSDAGNATQTDSIGHFEVQEFRGGFLGCPDLKIRISAAGHLDKEVTNPQDDTIFLSK